MNLYRDHFDRVYRAREIDASIPPDERFAGANARIPQDVHSVLDVGCGDGQFLRWLPDGYQKVGLDFSREALSRVGAPKVQGTVEALPFPDASFDLVTCFEVIEHLSPQAFEPALRELERVSRRYIMVSVPNREVLAESLVWCPYCSCVFHPSWHVRAFDERALARLFVGLRMVECRPCGPVARYGRSRLAALAVLLARRSPPPVALCPQCGFSETARDRPVGDAEAQAPRRAHRGRGGGLVWEIAKRALFTARRPYWLLALYARADGAAAGRGSGR